jgi:hypothetical protein
LTLNGLLGVISQKIILFITTAVRTSNPTSLSVILILSLEKRAGLKQFLETTAYMMKAMVMEFDS